jgi:hypothetical protein
VSWLDKIHEYGVQPGCLTPAGLCLLTGLIVIVVAVAFAAAFYALGIWFR